MESITTKAWSKPTRSKMEYKPVINKWSMVKKSPRKLLNKVNSFVNGNQGWILLIILYYLIRSLQA